MPHVNVFVFGTLRVESYRWARDAEVAEPVCNVTTKGTMYDNYGSFPYVDFDGNGIIYGDILTFDDGHPDYLRMRYVEQNAGYVEREVEVTTRHGVIPVLAWDATVDTKAHYLPRLRVVTSGDWLLAEEQSRRAYLDA